MTEAVKKSKDQKTTDQITKAEQDFADDLAKASVKDDNNRVLWKNKLINAFNQRQGFVTIKNWPWRGAAEFTVPFTDKTISKLKSTSMMSAIGNKKWIVAKPRQDQVDSPFIRQACKKQEKAANRIFQDKRQDFLKKLSILIDGLFEKGKFIAKLRAKFTVRPVQKTLIIKDLIEIEIQRAQALGQVNQQQQLDLDELVKGFKKQPNEELYQFLERKFGFDREDKADKKQMNDLIGRFKNGEEEIEFMHKEVHQRVDIMPIMLERFVVPKSTMEMKTTPRLVHEFFVSKAQMLLLIEEGVYDRDALKDGSSETGNIESSFSNLADLDRAIVEGITTVDQDSDIIKIHEGCGWFKSKPTVFTYLPDSNNKLLKKPHPVPHTFSDLEDTVWPYIEHNLEYKDGRYYGSRGIPEKVQSVQAILDLTQNNMINRDIINNTPMFLLSKASDLNERKVRFVPGQILNTTQDGEIKRFDTGQVDISSERIGQIAKAWGEELVGSIDFSLNNATNPGGAKTAEEIRASQQNAAIIPQLDTLLLINTLGEMATMAMSIFKDRFTRPLTIDGLTITKADLEVPCDFFWNGSLEQADKGLQESKAFNRIAVLIQGQQTGVVNQDDIYNAYFDWLDNGGSNDPDRYITHPEEQAKQQIEQLNGQIKELQQGVINMDSQANELQKEVFELKEEKVVAEENLDLQILKNKSELDKERLKAEGDLKEQTIRNNTKEKKASS